MKVSSLIFRGITHKSGLTLIEILVVAVIFSIIAAMLFTVFKTGLESWRRMESNLEIYQNARIASDMMTRELRAALLDPSYVDIATGNPWITFRGFNGGGTAPTWGWKPNSIGDELYFIAALNPTSPARFDLCRAGYWLDGNGTGTTRDDSLRRFYDVQTGSPPNYDFSTPGTSNKLGLYVTELNLRYWDPAVPGFVDTWDSTSGTQSGRLPKMVEITITVREPNPINPNSPKTERFITNVYIPRSQK